MQETGVPTGPMWKGAALDGAAYLILHGAAEDHRVSACIDGDRLRRSSIVQEEQPAAIVSDAVTHIVEQLSVLGFGSDDIEWMWEARH